MSSKSVLNGGMEMFEYTNEMNRHHISRRSMIAMCGAGSLMPMNAMAGLRCSARNSSGVQTCTAGVIIGPFETARQRKWHWCWAASIQTIFATHGYRVAQERIVQKLFGGQIDRGATISQIVKAIDGRWVGDRGAHFFARGVVLWNRPAYFRRPDAIFRAAQELQNGNPLIFASERHATVLTAMTYQRGPLGGIAVDSLIVRDPWPFNHNRRPLRRDEILRSNFLCCVYVTPAPT